MARPVSLLPSGGAPYVSVTDGPPATPVNDGSGPPVTLVTSGAPPICLVDATGTVLGGLAFAGNAWAAWDFINNEARYANNYEGVLANTPGWSYARADAQNAYAQNAAGVLIPFSTGQLRRTDKGVLIEGARTNLCLQSQTFDNASWSKTAGAVTANAAVAPDGTTTADEFISSGAHSYIRQNITVSAATAYTFSVYLKASVNSWALVEVWNSGVTKWSGRYVNLATGALGSATSGGGGLAGTVSTETLGNGWFRVIVSLTSDNTTLTPVVYVADADLDTTVSNLASLYLWGAQLEAASFPSSLVTTTTASATRAADVLTVPVSGIAAPVSMFVEFERVVDTGTFEGQFVFNDGTFNNTAILQVLSTDIPQARCDVAAAAQAQIGIGSALALNTVTRLAARIATNDFQAARGGVLGTADTSGSTPACTQISFGAYHAGNFPSFGYLRRAALWNRALSDAELTALTL